MNLDKCLVLIYERNLIWAKIYNAWFNIISMDKLIDTPSEERVKTLETFFQIRRLKAKDAVEKGVLPLVENHNLVVQEMEKVLDDMYSKFPQLKENKKDGWYY